MDKLYKTSLPFLLILLSLQRSAILARSPAVVAKEDLGAMDYFHPGRVYYLEPEQVHLSYWGDPTQMWVTWVTLDNHTLDNKPIDSFIQWGENDLTYSANGSVSYFADEGKEKRIIYIHRALMTGLKPDKKHLYHVGGPRTGWSDVFTFRAMRAGHEWTSRFAMYGDMGNSFGISIPPLQVEAWRGNFDAVFHYGDFAYDLSQDGGRFGDTFMNQIQPIASRIPYMTTPGNHEYHYNFLHYKKRFTMPPNGVDSQPNMFYSVDIGPVHFVAICTEFLYYTGFGWKQNALQYEWLVADLKKATRPENLARHPWIVLMGHRPAYCNTVDYEHCQDFNMIRTGFPGVNAYGFDDLMFQYGVDIAFWAHEHSYERTFPVYNMTVMNGTGSDPYEDPGATVHIINGAPGNREKNDYFYKPKSFSAFRNSDYGYGRMTVFNATHLYFEQVSAEKGSVIDSVTLVKNLHGPAAFRKWKSKKTLEDLKERN